MSGLGGEAGLAAGQPYARPVGGVPPSVAGPRCSSGRRWHVARALRNPDDRVRAKVVDAINAAQPITIELLYSDQVGLQRTISRFGLTPANDSWLVGLNRHWYLDWEGPRPESLMLAATEAILRVMKRLPREGCRPKTAAARRTRADWRTESTTKPSTCVLIRQTSNLRRTLAPSSAPGCLNRRQQQQQKYRVGCPTSPGLGATVRHTETGLRITLPRVLGHSSR